MERTGPHHIGEFPPDVGHAGTDAPPIDLELGLSGPPRADPSAEAGEARPDAREPREEVAQLRQLHLELAFFGPRPLGKDVENQLGTVEHLHFKASFQIASLCRRQLVVEDDEIGLDVADDSFELFDLSGPKVRRWVGSAACLVSADRDHGSCAFCETCEFIEALLEIPGAILQVKTGEHAPLAWGLVIVDRVVSHSLPPPQCNKGEQVDEGKRPGCNRLERECCHRPARHIRPVQQE